MADAWKTKTASSSQANLPLQDQINPAQVRQVDIKKNGNVIKTINVRRRSKYFNDGSARVF